MLNQTLIYSGTSMFPSIKGGDYLIMRKTPWGRLKIGDVVVLKTSGPKHPIVHRLVGWRFRGAERFGLLKGDNLMQTDPFLLSPENYLGKVWAVEKNGRPVSMISFFQRLRALWTAHFSKKNLTPGILRYRVKKKLNQVVPRIPAIKILKRILLKKARCFIFSGQANSRRLCFAWGDVLIGEIVIAHNSLRIVDGSVSSIFSSFISSEDLKASALEMFPNKLKA